MEKCCRICHGFSTALVEGIPGRPPRREHFPVKEGTWSFLLVALGKSSCVQRVFKKSGLNAIDAQLALMSLMSSLGFQADPPTCTHHMTQPLLDVSLHSCHVMSLSLHIHFLVG